MTSDELKKEIKGFFDLQKTLSSFGANDSEPIWYFTFLVNRAIEGKALPNITIHHWQLYDHSGWEEAAETLTKEASRIYHLIQSSPVIEVVGLRNYL